MVGESGVELSVGEPVGDSVVLVVSVVAGTVGESVGVRVVGSVNGSVISTVVVGSVSFLVVVGSVGISVGFLVVVVFDKGPGGGRSTSLRDNMHCFKKHE